MKLMEEGQLLRIFIGSSDTYEGRPLYEQIVSQAKALNLAGATVLRGVMGFGARSRVHTTKFLRLSEDMPIVIEIVDSQAYIDLLLPFLDEAVQEGLITVEKVQIIRYGEHRRQERGAT